MFETWRRNELATSIIECRAGRARLGLRMKVTVLADDLVSVWAMLAIAYRPE